MAGELTSFRQAERVSGLAQLGLSHLVKRSGCSNASLAYALREVGRLGDSIAAYRRAIAFPENAASASVRNNYGITLAMAGQRDEARAEFREALRLDPALTSARDNLMKVGGP